MPFIDRNDAGRRLAKALASYKGQKPVVLALPRGGVPVAAKVAEALNAPLDLLLVRKIGVPFQPELAMGAVVDGISPVTVRNEDVITLSGISEQDFSTARDHELEEIERRRKTYLGDRPHPELSARVVIVVDDGAHGELRLKRHADLAHQDQVERGIERDRDLGRDRPAAARQREHDRPLLRDNLLARLHDREAHFIEFAQQVIRKLKIGLVDLVDEQHVALRRHERLAERTELDVATNVTDVPASEAAVV